MAVRKKKHSAANGAVKSAGKLLNPMTNGVKWSEKHADSIDKFWSKLPTFFSQTVLVIAVLLLGLAVSGNWINILVHLLEHFGWNLKTPVTAETFLMQGLMGFWISSNVVSYAMYFLIGGFIHWHFYVRQRDRPQDWKCQPQKWMTASLETHEILFGSLTLFVNASLSAIISCYIYNGGYSTVYYHFSDYPWWWTLLQGVAIFLYQDYTTYWLHRIYHTPFLYKHFHKLHHKYKQPTAFSVTAIHPVESVSIQLTYLVPLFVVPVHWAIYYSIMLYVYYHGIIDHSGVNFKAFWWQPWQPDAIFHDNHHQYFHVNFGFNIYIWDKLHGTHRRTDRIYTEDIYYGQGKSIQDASQKELAVDIAERKSENPKAYRGDRMAYELSANILSKKSKKGKL